jgi:hypothetical protein
MAIYAQSIGKHIETKLIASAACSMSSIPAGQRAANLRLIRSAPEMLEMLVVAQTALAMYNPDSSISKSINDFLNTLGE